MNGIYRVYKDKNINNFVTTPETQPESKQDFSFRSWLQRFFGRRYNMTKNQIEYGKLLEGRRANLAQEDLTRRRDTAAREAKLIELSEVGRHNLAQEQYQKGSLDEQSRHNTALEGLQSREIDLKGSTLTETKRANRAREMLQSQQNVEAKRSNLAKEELGRIQATETQRSNMAREQETTRSNLAREKETSRHNIVSEGISAGELASQTITREQSLLETSRHNRAMEAKDYSTKVSLNPTQTQSYPTYNVGSNNSLSVGRKSGGSNSATQKKDSPSYDRSMDIDLGFFKKKSRTVDGNRTTSTEIDLWPFD